MECLSDELLLLYLSGDESKFVAEDATAHIDSCESCSERLEAVCNDTLIRQLREDHLRRSLYERRKQELNQSDIGITHTLPLAGDGSFSPGPAIDQVDEIELRMVGSYRIETLIGKGGMGSVYRACHLRLKRYVALKILNVPSAAGHTRVARFQREMEAIGALRHPNVVQAYDAGEANGVHFIAMELVEGQNVDQAVGRGNRIALDKACEIVRQAALGLSHAHENGFIHRDIKPSNLLLTLDGQVKLSDLGLALALSDDSGGLTSTDVVVGTFDYMSPEQASPGERVDARSDLYSLGCVFYRLLTGTPPFGGSQHSSPRAKIRAHLLDQPIDVSEYRVDIPAELQYLLMSLLAKSPDLRPASASELVERITKYCADSCCQLVAERGYARPTGSPPSLQSIRARLLDQKAWLVAAVSFVFLASAGGLIAFRIRDYPPQGVELSKDLSVHSEKVSVAKTTIPLDYKEPDIWHSLLDTPSELLWWPRGPGTSIPQHDTVKQEVVAIATDVGLIKLTAIGSSKYRLQIGIRQAAWEGGAGIFFGYHPVSEDSSKRQCQAIFLVKGVRPDSYQLQRALVVFSSDMTSPNVSTRVLTGATVPPPGPHEHILELTVFDGRITRATWSGQDLASLTDPPGPPGLLNDADYVGSAGLFLNNGSAVFTNCRGMIFEDVPSLP